MKKKIIISALIPLILAGTLLTCQQQEKKEANVVAIPDEESAIAVTLTAVKSGEYSLPVISSGLISTETESKLSFKIPGIITEIFVKEGQSVIKGQLLATLDLTEINAQVVQAKNSLDKMKRDLERGQRLYRDSAATLEQVQNLQTGYEVAEQGLRIASFNQQYATIHAPASGKVIKKFVSEGEMAGAGSPILIVNTAAQNGDWIVRIGLPDVDWVRVKKGDKAVVTTDAYTSISFEAEVSNINEGADLVNGLYQAEVKINPQGMRLASGLFARVEIVPSESQSLKSIPIESLIEGDGKNAFVFVVNPDQKSVSKMPVRIAYLQNKEAIIFQGLEKVTEVVNEGSAFLTEFSTVTVSH